MFSAGSPRFCPERTKILGARSLRLVQGAGACAEEKTQSEDATVDPPTRCKKRKEGGTRRRAIFY